MSTRLYSTLFCFFFTFFPGEGGNKTGSLIESLIKGKQIVLTDEMYNFMKSRSGL